MRSTGTLRFRSAIRAVWMSPTLMIWASLAVRIGGLALLLPVVLVRLKASEVLVWQMLSTITLLTSWADFGFSPTFARVIAFTRGGGRLADLHMPEAVRRRLAGRMGALGLHAVLATQRQVYRRLIAGAVLLAAIGGTAALIRPVAAMDRPIEGWIAWLITLGSTTIILLNGSLVSVLTGFDRIADTRRRDAVVGALQLTSAALVTLAGGGVAAVVACYSIWLVPLYLQNRRHARRLAVTPGDAESASQADVLAAVWPAAWRSGVGILMSAGVIQASGLIYAQYAPAATAAAYLLALRAMSAASQLSQAPFYSKLPSLAQLRGERRHDALIKLAERGMALAEWAFVLAALGVVFVAPRLLELIGSSVRLPGFPMMALLTMAFFVERYSAMHLQLYSLTNHIVWHIANGVTGALMIVLFLVLRPLVGDLAMPGAMLLAYGGFCAWYTSRLSFRALAVPRWSFERRTSVGPAALMISALAAFALARSLNLGL